MLVDGVEPEELQSMLTVDLETFEARERQACRIWESLGAYAPTMGIVGAVMGLIQVMQNLSQPGALGSGIAVAFVSTLYGVGFANLLFLPLAGRIKARILDEVRLRRMLLEGFRAVAAGNHPRLVERRMRGHLASGEEA
jgi:chemotaxis protein MotA